MSLTKFNIEPPCFFQLWQNNIFPSENRTSARFYQHRLSKIALSRLSAKFHFLPHDVFIKTRQNRVEVHGNIKTCYGFSERLEYPPTNCAHFRKFDLTRTWNGLKNKRNLFSQLIRLMTAA